VSASSGTNCNHRLAIGNGFRYNIIVTRESEIEPAVEWVRRNHPQIKITVYVPVLEDERNQRRNDNYHRMGVTCKPLPLADIPRHVFPAAVRVNENETITRPVEWV
jgi:hypothetical protein